MAVSSELIDGLFGGALAAATDYRSSLAQAALSTATDRVTARDYEGALTQLKRAVALDPRGNYAPQAYDLMGQTYEQLGRTDDAAKAYKAMIALDPSSDAPYARLGKLYYGKDSFAESEKAYAQAVKLSPTSTTNLLSLGQAQMANGHLSAAETSFSSLVRMAPNEYGSHYSLGQVFAKEGRHEDAVRELEQTLQLDHTFDAARVDMGQSLLALGRFDEAKQQLSVLEHGSSSVGSLLKATIEKATPPKIDSAYSSDGFTVGFGPGTPVAWLNPQLATPGAVKEFSLTFYFTKTMDEASVENIYDWSINRTALGSRSGAYNNNKPVPLTEAGVSPVPNRVIYDKESGTARVFFTVRQNAGGNATLDPSHLRFKFAGVDAYGTAIDPTADEYNAISAIG